MHPKNHLRNASRSIPACGILLTHHLRASQPARCHTHRRQNKSCSLHVLDQLDPPRSSVHESIMPRNKMPIATSVGRASYCERKLLRLRTGRVSCPPKETDSFLHWQACHSHTASHHFHASPTPAHSTHHEVFPTRQPHRESQLRSAKALCRCDQSSSP